MATASLVLRLGFPRPVLIIGERGTGKDLIASRLPYLSVRWERQPNFAPPTISV